MLLLSLAALTAAVACDDRQEETKSPTAPVAQQVAPDAALVGDSASTICRAYSRELVATKGLQTQNPQDDKLRLKVTTLNAVIADACR